MDSSEHSAPPRPTPEVGRRVEELLREQLEERGVNPRALLPEEISRGMECRIAPDNSMAHVHPGRHAGHAESGPCRSRLTRRNGRPTGTPS